jgi:hypothetical protein
MDTQLFSFFLGRPCGRRADSGARRCAADWGWFAGAVPRLGRYAGRSSSDGDSSLSALAKLDQGPASREVMLKVLPHALALTAAGLLELFDRATLNPL